MLTLIQIDCSHAATPSGVGLDPHDHRELAVFYHSLRWNDCPILPDNSQCHLLAGFHRPEKEGTWSARRSLILLDGTEPRRDAGHLEMDASVFETAFPSCRVYILTSSGFRGQTLVGPRATRQIRLRRPWFSGRPRLVVARFAGLATRKNVTLGGAEPDVSIIVPQHNRSTLTRLCSMAAASSHIHHPFEILCVDNGSSAEELAALSRAEVPLRVVQLRSNMGFGAACNAGAKEARGSYLLFLNNDAFLRPGTVDELLAAFAAQPDCGAVGPVMLNIDDSVQEAGCSLQADGHPVHRGRNDTEFRMDTLPRFEPVDYVSAACLMVKRDEFLAMGGFQGKYNPAYYEDTDFCLRLLMRQKRVYLASKTGCYHIENATSREIENGAWATRTSEAHREIFLQDWAPYLASRHPADFPNL